MDLTLGFALIVAFLVAYLVFAKPKNLPPGPLCMPIIGSMLFFRQFQNRRRDKVFHAAAKQYGSVMSVRIGPRLAVVLDGYDVIHEAFVKKADVFSDRPVTKGIFQEALKDIPGKGIILHQYGDSWRMLRRFTLQALRDFGVGKTSIEEKIFAEVEAITKCLDESKGEPICMNPLLQSAIGNIIYGIIFGRRYDYDDPEFETIRQLSTVAFSGQGLFSPISFLPRCIAKLFVSKNVDDYDKRLKSVETIRDYVLTQIDEHEVTFDPDIIRDFVDIYLQTKIVSKPEEEQLTKGTMFRVIVDLFLAGSETTSTTLDWSFLYMSEFPEVQRKCQKEIDEVVGQRPIGYADQVNLPYVCATIQEILRVSNIAPFAVVHSTSRDTTLRGYTIPADAIILANLYSASIDPKYWEEPGRFNPGRFMDESGKCIKREANIPFSEGPRICLGEPLARTELFVVLANLLQRFEFHRESNSVRATLEPKLFQLTNAPQSYKLRVTRRF